jgi:hypothetical protein
LPVCLDFSAFEEQGFNIEILSAPETTTLVGESEVSVFIDYPIKITREDVEHEIENFFVALPVSLKRIYEFAVEITETQNQNKFLERQALNLITAFSALDSDSLPPKTEVEFNFMGGTIWSKSKTKESVENILSSYVSAIQIPFTQNYEQRFFPGEDIRTAFYAMEPPVNLDLKYEDMAVRFDYLGWWPIYFDLNCNGDLCMPESANNPLLSVVGLQRYDFVYDISFPVVVDITEPDAFFEEGYSFKFALEANLRNNEAITSEFPGYDVGFESARTQLCDLEMRNSGDITIKTKDRYSKSPIPEVDVVYTCGTESCPIGRTDDNGNLIEKFPVCTGGIISFINQDYMFTAQAFNTKSKKEDLVVAEAYRFTDINMTAMKWRYDLGTKELGFNPVDLEQDEQLMITLNRVQEDTGEDKVSSIAEFWGNQTQSSEILRIVPGLYEVEGNMILNRLVVIPEDKRRAGGGFIAGLLGGDEEFTIPEVRFEDGYPSGGLSLVKKTGYMEISADYLYNSKEIRFFVIGYTIPTKVEHTEVDLEKLSSRFRGDLEPEFRT